MAVRPWWLGGRKPRSHGIFDGLNVLRETGAGWRDGILAAESTANRDGRSRLQVVQAIDCADWLPHDLLIKIDRCLMAHGVEGRTPLLDPAVAAASYPLADDPQVRTGQGTYLLRCRLAARLPSAHPVSRNPFSPSKMPWLRGVRPPSHHGRSAPRWRP